MKVVLPDFLKAGDTIAIVSPSGIVEREPIMDSLHVFEQWGLNVVLGQSVFERSGMFAGTDTQRSDDFNDAIHNKDIKAIFCSRGGYGAARIAKDIDFEYLKCNPKWIIGFSDITVFHSVLNNYGICSIHGVMPNSFTKTHKNSLSSLRSMLFGDTIIYETVHNSYNVTGRAEGNLVGGNLSILFSLRGTPFDIDYENTILFIEDIGEKLYHLDRMMVNLRLSGILNKVRGIVVGGFSDMIDGNTSFGKTSEEIIYSHCYDLKIPLLFDFMAGHIFENNALLFGKKVLLDVQMAGGKLKF